MLYPSEERYVATKNVMFQRAPLCPSEKRYAPVIAIVSASAGWAILLVRFGAACIFGIVFGSGRACEPKFNDI
jgi:hypothetical protein